MGRVKVLYIGGTGRTGSTVLEKVLGQAEGVFAGGELTFLWRFRDTGRCSCGAPIRRCPVWTAVFDAAFGGMDGVDAARQERLHQRFHSRHLPLMLVPGLTPRLERRLGEFPETVERLYGAMAEVTGSRLLVDSSKEPHYSWVLRQRGGLDVRFLHLVRDPRAVAHSWGRRKRQAGLDTSEDMERRRPAVSSLYYDVSNVAAEALWRRRPDAYLRLRYEDLVADPAGALARIEALVEEPLHLDLSAGTIEVGPTHSAWGNPNRFQSGTVTLRPDTEWAERLPAAWKAVVTAMTAPLLLRYGYPLWPSG